jgi:uncharacterized protein YndB with AHSA1/START domain
MTPKLVISSIRIQASKAAVWDALVNPAKTKVYMFGCETVSDWKVGSSLLWQMMYEGNLLTAVKGNVVTMDAPNYLAYTVFDPNNQAMDDIPENYLTVTYALEDVEGQVQLTVTQGDYNTVAEGEKRYAEAYNGGEGWNPILVQIKALVEGA